MTRIVLVALALATVLTATDRAAPRRAIACNGGGDPLEWAATHADLIVIGDIIHVGDAENHAPTVTPSPRPSGTPPAGTSPALSATPGPFDFTGIGATMRVVRVIAGEAPEIVEVDAARRASLERQARDLEAGIPRLDSCLDTFVIHYATGARYLMFISDRNRDGGFVRLAFPIDGSDLITGDESLVRANNGTLYVETTTYHLLMEGLPTSVADVQNIYLAPGRVPLATVLRVIAKARGDPSIAPPETGSAGLASGRR